MQKNCKELERTSHICWLFDCHILAVKMTGQTMSGDEENTPAQKRIPEHDTRLKVGPVQCTPSKVSLFTCSSSTIHDPKSRAPSLKSSRDEAEEPRYIGNLLV